MNATHKRRARLAECTQHHGSATIIRCAIGEIIGTVRPGDWRVIGEDGQLRIYNNTQFNLMYERILA